MNIYQTLKLATRQNQKLKNSPTVRIRPIKVKSNHDGYSIKVTSLLEEEIAKKIVNKIITEMGNDMKNLMSNKSIREDFRFFMCKGVENILEKVK